MKPAKHDRPHPALVAGVGVREGVMGEVVHDVAMTAEERPMLVTYRGSDVHLTREEYDELKRLAYDDPVEADRLGRVYLRRENLSDAGGRVEP